MDVDGQLLRRSQNEVVCVNGESFSDYVLKPRLQNLLAAQNVEEIIASLDSTKLSLQTLGTFPSFELRGTKDNIQTVVDLRNCLPAHSVSVQTHASNDLYRVSGQWQVYNQLRLGDRLKFSLKSQPNPFSLAAGRASLAVPVPHGRGVLNFAGFFFNENREWASYALATHGVSAEIRVPWVCGIYSVAGVRAVARNIHSISDAAGDLVRCAAGNSSLKVGLHFALAQKGEFHSLKAKLETAAAPGDAQHVKAEGEVKLAFPLVPKNVLDFVYSTNVGVLTATSDKVELYDQFFLGGPTNLLGFDRNKVRAMDVEPGDYIGGQAFYHSRFALIGGLPMLQGGPLRLKAQIDAGVLLQKSQTSFKQGLTNLFNHRPALSTGAGLTYKTERSSFDVLYVFPVSNDGEHARSSISVSATLNLD